MARASYNNGSEVVELTILKENKNGTLDLSADGETLKVGVCPIDDSDSSAPAVGSCRKIVEAPKADPKK
jgi:hypothetical protein